MHCFNALSAEQQTRLIEVGNLPLGYTAEELLKELGERLPTACERPASVAIECASDAAPGPRFYCRLCAIAYLEGLA